MEVVVEPHRLFSGLFGFKEGDIRGAYSCDVVPKIRTPFVHEGKQYTVGSTCFCSHSNDFAYAYELISIDQYKGPDEQRGSYEGKTVTFRGKQFRLGPEIKFIQRPFTVAEKIAQLRGMFAHGGMFAANKSYHELLREWQERYEDDVTLQAIVQELTTSECKTQEEMRNRLSSKVPPSDATVTQLAFDM